MKKLGFVFVDRRTDPSVGIPLVCPVCDFALRTVEDRQDYESKKCCQKCAHAFADPNESRWKDGWRPSKEIIDIEVSRRLEIPVSVDLSWFEDS